jgi:hypothetical protein
VIFHGLRQDMILLVIALLRAFRILKGFAVMVAPQCAGDRFSKHAHVRARLGDFLRRKRSSPKSAIVFPPYLMK